jgi:hypothetical protein
LAHIPAVPAPPLVRDKDSHHDPDTTPTPRRAETWCVTTECGNRDLLDFGGFGPVTVWSNGLLVPVIYRHRFGQSSAWPCPVCADPSLAHPYLPPISWQTPDPLRTADPGSGDPDRGAFAAVFHRGPNHPRMWVSIYRSDSWHRWCHHANVNLDPRGDWRAQFDAWRSLGTGYRRDGHADHRPNAQPVVSA